VPIDPQHLLEQADRLAAATQQGRPRGVDLRRAISAAYYAMFHFVLRTATDTVISTADKIQYARVYRSLDHKPLRDLCRVVSRTGPPGKFAAYLPSDGFALEIEEFAAAFIDLQEKRHLADYDPYFQTTKSDTTLTIRTARTAIDRFDSAPSSDREAFLSLLLFPPR
jgi:uncharacterized protein (UPF0332 family)